MSSNAIKVSVEIKEAASIPVPGRYGVDFTYSNGYYIRLQDGAAPVTACNNEGPTYICTLPEEHLGPHMAEDLPGLEIWD